MRDPDIYFVGICDCGHDEYAHTRKIGPYVLCDMPGCKCADRNYIRSEKRRRKVR